MNVQIGTTRLTALLIAVLLLAKCQIDKNAQDLAAGSEKQNASTYNEMMNVPLVVDFGESKIYEVVFHNDSSFYWKSMRTGNHSTEATKTIILDDYRVLTHWVEKDSTVVSILTDFGRMRMNGFETFSDQRSIYLIGDLTAKN